jgi:glyceraldehyde 3-phosphate dehydrogenase
VFEKKFTLVVPLFPCTFVQKQIMIRIAINGLGRIGRLAFKLLHEHPEVELVAVNDLAPNAFLAHLLQFDTAHGTWDKQISFDDEHLIVDGHPILCTSIAAFKDLPWQENKVDIVIECTGIARNKEKAMEHIEAGAKKVIISAPADKATKTVVIGVNEDIVTADDLVISNASCTTNCLAPMVRVMKEQFGIESAIMSTVHAYTADQNLHDGIHKSDYRRARAAAENIVPTTSNATKTLEIVMPDMKGKFIGGAMRVPILVGSLTELYVNLSRPADKAAVNAAMKAASEAELKGILGYTEAPMVSSDIVGSPYSCLFDAQLTSFAGDRFCKLVGWYDNEYGYTCRLIELTLQVAKL